MQIFCVQVKVDEMLAKTRLLTGGVAAVMALGLVACGQSGSSEPAGAGQVATAPAAVASLKITSYGPDHTKAGAAFNVQPNGDAAMWIHVNRSLDGGEAAIDFNGTLLKGNISGDLVTAAVPAALYAKAGVYQVQVFARKGAESSKSNAVPFTVQ